MTQQTIIKRAEPFLFPRGPVGCVLVHGFTGTPLEMRAMGEFLAERGHTVIGVRLAGHATHIEDMMRTRYQDWLASAEDGYHMLRERCEKIFMLGLSLGGAISLTMANRLPLAGVVAMSTPYHLPVRWARKNPWLVHLLAPIKPSMAKNQRPWHTPGLQEDHISYSRNPVRSGYELYKLLKVMQNELPRINIPTLIVHSHDDLYILEHHADLVYNGIGSEEKQLVWTDNCSHAVTRDGDTSRVFEPIAAFLDNYS